MSSITTDQIQSKLFARSDLPPLEPGTTLHNQALKGDIDSLGEHDLIKASLHLINDDIDGCHTIVGEIYKQPDADVMHACLHRREGDYSNAHYWYNGLPKHPLIPSKQASASFIDACEKVKKSGDDDAKLRETQWEEMKGIVEYMRGKYSK